MMVKDDTSWIQTVFAIRGSSLTRTWGKLVLVTLFAGVVTYLHETYGYLHTNLTVTPFSLIGLALGIFLGFRNNTSYDRFWEGRKLWGRVVNASRTFTRQILTLVGPSGASVAYRYKMNDDGTVDAEVRALHERLIRRLIAYVHALRLHLRGQREVDELAEFLDDDELAELVDESNRPIALLQRMGAELRTAWDRGLIHEMHLPVLEASMTELAGVQGGCERIKATPIPFSYNILLHRIVFVYCFTLPLGLVSIEGLGQFTPIVVLLVSYAFFGLDAVGDEIEDPFGEDVNDLPLSTITRMIEINLKERLGEEDLPEFKKPVKGVLT